MERNLSYRIYQYLVLLHVVSIIGFYKPWRFQKIMLSLIVIYVPYSGKTLIRWLLMMSMWKDVTSLSIIQREYALPTW
jgi:hypothetical protein